MQSPNQIYDYLRYLQVVGEKRTIVRNYEDGVLNPFDLWMHTDNNNPYIKDTYSRIWKMDPIIDMYDQEPIHIEQMKFEYDKKIIDIDKNGLPENWIVKPLKELSQLNDIDFFSATSSSLYAPIICHSEKNSKVINDINNTGMFIDVHYWFHGLLSRYWFNEYRMFKKNTSLAKKRFGIYARSFNGDGKYRKELLENLSIINDNVYYNKPDSLNFDFLNVWNTNSQQITSSHSAKIEWQDVYNFDIQIVPETIIDRTHLTEKVFKPIVMHQPFILMSGYKSLDYLRQYGFKTFNTCWDESYDLIIDNNERLTKVIDTINKLNDLSETEYALVISKAREIAEYNHKLFYSDKFTDKVYKELLQNLDNANVIQNEMLFANPGGTLFHNADVFVREFGYLPEIYKNNLIDVLNKINNSVLTNDIKEKYKKLIALF